MASETRPEKAARLLREDCVRRVPDATVYEVRGDSDTYLVVASPEVGIHCPCDAYVSLCSHTLAVAGQWAKDDAEGAAAYHERLDRLIGGEA